MYEIYEMLLNERGVTSYKVSMATGISQATLGNWKKRRTILNPKHLRKIADYFGVSIDYMMGNVVKEDNSTLSPADEDALAIARRILRLDAQAKRTVIDMITILEKAQG